MGKLYSLISALLLAIGVAYAAPDGYQWWFDHDVSSAQYGTLSGGALDFEIDTSNLPKGIHYFNLRLSEGDSIIGSVYRKMFHSLGKDKGAISYEYWYDNDYASKVAGAMDIGSNHLKLDISNLPEGAHYFNCRVGYGDGSWGTVYRKMVLNLAGSVNAVAYEYWIDNNYTGNTTGSLSPGANSYLVDLDGVRKGLHRFNYRMKTGEGMWGTIYTKYFYNASNEARFTEYEYWLDNDYGNRKSATVTSNPVSFEVDLAGFDKSGNAHFFNLRTRDGDGDWSPIYRKLLVFNNEEKRVPILGYRNFVNGVDIGYVEVARELKDSYMFEVSLPDSMRSKVRNLTPIFEGDKVSLSGTDSLEYVMHPKTEFGWGAPQKWKLAISNPFSTTAVEMTVNSRQSFGVPTIDKFVAIKFDATSNSLYFRADIPIALDLYRDGNKVAELSAEDIASIGMIKLEAGTYYGILRDAERTSESGQFTFHIMDTPNAVPMPVISYEDGMISMSCSRSDAEIRYTLDGSVPTMESTLYTAPFALTRNAVIWAIAYIPNSDIEPSEVAELVVDSYKTATPTSNFDLSTKTLTLECATEGATISYTFNPDEGWTVYTAPILIESNCTVYAKAEAPGYNESDILTINVGELKCSPVKISYNGRYANIQTDEPETRIKYSVDGSDPVEGADYSGEFDVKGLCTVKAIAVKEGHQNSEISELRIDGYADEYHAETAAGGLLESCYEWSGRELPDSFDEFRVEGTLNDADYAFLKSLNNLTLLDIEKVKDARIPDYAFTNTGLITVIMPSDLTEYGDSILSGCGSLCALVWNSETKDIESRLSDGLANPNVLVYVPSGIKVENLAHLNIIEAGRSETIILHYGHPFNVPVEFDADVISLSRDFTKKTEVGQCGGWETLTLPFEPEQIRHEKAGDIVPFNAWSGDGAGSGKPFWLYNSSTDGWEKAGRIQACVPYIISMPNSADYLEEYNLAGRVTFSAGNVTLTPESSMPYLTTWTNGMQFVGTFMPVDTPEVRSLNQDGDDAYLPGSAFVENVAAEPFGAYVTGTTRKSIPVFGDWSGILLPTVTEEGLAIESPAPGMLRISSGVKRKVDVVSATGVVVRTLHLKAGETITIEGLTRDLYLVGRTKVMVK